VITCPLLETPRLRVRPVAAHDLPDLLAVNGDADVTRFLPYPAWTSLADGQAWLERMAALQAAGSAWQLVVVDKASNAAVGTCLLFRFEPTSRRAELGYVLGRAFWGRGVMAEALGALIGHAFGAAGLRRLEAEVNPANGASTRLLQRLGFVQEGLLRQRWVARGEPYDVAAFGLLSHEWRASP
jgi:[ribosomal protein S5]-alanine N-acetyltransferase